MSSEPGRASFVYIVQIGDDGPIKIGTSHNVVQRMRSFLAAGAFGIRARRVMRGTAVDERALHARFVALRFHGEWFHPGPDLVAFANERGPDDVSLPAEEPMRPHGTRAPGGGARPRVPGEKALLKIDIRMTPEEKAAIQRNARKAGMEPSAYIRHLGLTAPEHPDAE